MGSQATQSRGLTAAAAHAKTYGAFYTDPRVADFLVSWAIRSPGDVIIDPSFGEGVFLRSACRHLLAVGGDPATQVSGMELDPLVHRDTGEVLHREFGISPANLQACDFFSVDVSSARHADAVVGNPPFIRYHRFNGSTRDRALLRAAMQGVRLSRLASSWAPFLVHSAAMVRDGGRLAMVVPAEIAHAGYARPVIRHLTRSFGRVTLLSFGKRLFPHLSEDTMLVLAEGKGEPGLGLYWRDVPDVEHLTHAMGPDTPVVGGATRLGSDALSPGSDRLVEQLIRPEAKHLYRELVASPGVGRMGDWCDVGIGYVTGANHFFHLGPDLAQRWQIPEHVLRPAVCRGRALSGLRFTEPDWRRSLATGDSAYLLLIGPDDEVDATVGSYLAHGEQQGVAGAYKCRTRRPWYAVPHVYHPDALLSYMSGDMPRLVANDAHVVAPNTLHVVRIALGAALSGDALAALWRTSLTRLSTEIEGHALGGGMLKLEPTEARRVAVVRPSGSSNGDLREAIADLDALTRRGDDAAAQEYADKAVLRNLLGLTQRECELLRIAAEDLRERRYGGSL